MQAHDPGPFIVERPARLKAIDEALKGPSFASLLRREASLRTDVEGALLRAHTRAQFDRLKVLATDKQNLPHATDGDTVLSAGYWEAALCAVGAGLDAVDAVMKRDVGITNAFCAVRPPGHHAEGEKAMGSQKKFAGSAMLLIESEPGTKFANPWAEVSKKAESNR